MVQNTYWDFILAKSKNNYQKPQITWLSPTTKTERRNDPGHVTLRQAFNWDVRKSQCAKRTVDWYAERHDKVFQSRRAAQNKTGQVGWRDTQLNPHSDDMHKSKSTMTAGIERPRSRRSHLSGISHSDLWYLGYQRKTLFKRSPFYQEGSTKQYVYQSSRLTPDIRTTEQDSVTEEQLVLKLI